MSTYKMQIQWRTCSNLDAIREAIAAGGREEVGQSPTNESDCKQSSSVASAQPCAGRWPKDDWPGLTSAEQIISVTWVQEMHCYTVVWRVRERQGVEA